MKYCEIDGTIRLRVFGADYQTGYDPSLRGTGCVQLIAEPDNPADANAVALMADDLRLGYLSRGFAEIWQPSALAASSSAVTLTASVTFDEDWTLNVPQWPEYGPGYWPSVWRQTGVRLARLTAAAHRLQQDGITATDGQVVKEESRLVVFNRAGDQIGQTGVLNRSPRHDLNLMLEILGAGSAPCVIAVDDQSTVWAIVNGVK